MVETSPIRAQSARRAFSLWVWSNAATFMGVFRKENAAAQLFREPQQQGKGSKQGESGFTLMELMIVMMIIGVLSAMAAPIFIHDVTMAREAVLKEDLHTMRVAIDSYTIDKEKGPQSLEDLVQAGYLKSIPIDPMTNHSDTWIVGQSEDLTSVNETQGGIDNVHSGAQGAGRDGSSYSTW